MAGQDPHRSSSLPTRTGEARCTPRSDPDSRAARTPTILVALVTACVVLFGGIGVPARTVLAADSTITPGSRLQPRPIPDLIRLRATRDLLRARLRAWRRDVAVRRPRPRTRRSKRRDDPRPLLPGDDARIDPGDHLDPCPRPVRVDGHAGRAAARLRPAGGVDDRRHRGVIPDRRGAAPDPHHDLDVDRPEDDLAPADHRGERGRPARCAEAGQRRRSQRGGAAACSSCGPSRARYDRYRGVLRILASATTPTVNVANELPLETYLRGVVPVEMPSTWPTQALKAQTIASRSYAARRLRPGVSYYDVTDDTSSQVYHGALGEKAATNALDQRDDGRRPAQPDRRDRQHAVPLDRRRRDREQRERLRVGDRREGGRRR